MDSLSDLAVEGAVLTAHVTPRARVNAVSLQDEMLVVRVTAVPDKGAANRAVAKSLGKALGWPPSRMTLVSGARSRIKRFRLD